VIAFLESSRYVLFFVGAMLEGPVMMLAGGVLLRLGQVEFVPIYAVLVAGDLAADIAWYCLGRYATRFLILKWGPFLKITPERIAIVERRFNRYHGKILLISKLTMGLGFAVITLTVAGMSRVPFRNFVAINLIGGLIWTMFLLTLGYYCGNVSAGIGRTEQVIFLAVVFVAFVLSLRFINRYLMTREP
jgi:membrane protein DedA with SNARE-associated domain